MHDRAGLIGLSYFTVPVGVAQFSPGGMVHFGLYSNGELAMTIVDTDGSIVSNPTVCLRPYGAPDAGQWGLWLRTWSEHTGQPEAFVAAGIVRLTERTYPIGYGVAQHAELTERIIKGLTG